MKNLRITVHFLVSLIMVISFTCNENPIESYDIFPEDFPGHLESDIDYAIIKPDGTVWTWGSNSTGQLGDGTMIPSENPKKITPLKNIATIDLIEGAAYAADIEGNIWFWGNRLIWEELPEYDTTIVIPKKISFLRGVKQLQVRGSNIYLLNESAELWKLNWNHNTPTKYMIPEQVSGINNIKMISQDLILNEDGSLHAFPGKEWVQMDQGGLSISVINDVEFVQNVFMRHTVILKKDSTVWAWGQNSAGCLGNGTYTDSSEPIKIDTLKNIISVSSEGSRCLALEKDGTVWFWGLIDFNWDKNLEIKENRPIKLEKLNNVKMIFASPVWSLLFMKGDGSYWSYDIKTEELKRIQL